MHTKSHGLENGAYDLPNYRVVVGHQDVHALKPRWNGSHLPSFPRTQAEPGGEGEYASFPGFTFHPDLTAHQFNNPPNDAQSKSSTTIPPGCGAICLRKRL